MKTILLIVVCVLSGMIIHHAVGDREELRDAQDQAQKEAERIKENMMDSAWDLAKENYYEACRTRYLTKTKCFQKPKIKADDCIKRIEKACGSPENPEVDY